MERTGMLREKENVEQQENGRMWDHASKLREARDARRKRILARSSERLAFITGEANAIPTSPLLDKTNSFSNSILNQDITRYHSPDQESTMKKSLFDEYEERKQSEAQKKIVNDRETASQEGAVVAQPLKNTETMETSKEQAQNEENQIPFKSKFSYCIKQSLFPRLICATCIALAFVAAGVAQGGREILSFPSTFGSTQSGHGSHRDAICMVCFLLAIVMLVDLLVLMGAFFFSQGRERKAMAKKATLFSMLWHLLLSISLDCSVSVSLLSGGFLLLPKYFV